jgi:hypothetical protein
MIGNALGDGKPKNTTENPQVETFQEKYRKQLKKDIDDEDEEAEEAEDTEETQDKSEEPVGEEINFDDDEEFVSSKDMFDEM